MFCFCRGEGACEGARMTSSLEAAAAAAAAAATVVECVVEVDGEERWYQGSRLVSLLLVPGGLYM